MVFKPVASSSKTVLDVTDAYSVTLSNEAISIACNTLNDAIDGELGSSGKANTDITIYKGNIKLTAVNSNETPTTDQFKYIIGTPVNCTANRTDNDSLYLDTISGDSGYVPITLYIENQVTLIKIFSWTKTKIGASTYSADITPSNGLTFTFNQFGENVGIASTKLTVNAINIASPKYIWKKNGSTIDGQTTNEITIYPDSLQTFNSVVYSCTVQGSVNNGNIIITDSVTVNKTQDGIDGDNPITGYLTNESITLSANKAGTVDSYSPATGTFKVSEGLIDKTLVSSFSLVSDTNCTAVIDAYGVYSLSAMTDEYASAEFKATYNGVEITKVVNMSKSKVGLTGNDAYNIVMYPSNGNVFKFSPDGENVGIVDTTLTVNTMNITSPSYSWFKDGDPISGETQSTLLVEADDVSSADITRYQCTVNGTANGSPISLTDVITIITSVDGQSALIGYLTNEVASVSASKEGTVADYSPANGIFKVIKGLDDISDDFIFNGVGTDCDLTINAESGAYSISGMTKDTATATMAATKGTIVVTKTMTISKVRVGLTGDNAYTLSIYPSNGNVFKFDSFGNSIGISSTTINTVLVNITPTSYVWKKDGSVILGATSSSYNVPSSQMQNNESSLFSVTVSGTSNGKSIEITEYITLYRNLDGANAISANLSIDSQLIPSDVDGNTYVNSYDNIGCAITVFNGGDEDSGWTASVVESAELVGTLNGLTYTVTELNGDSGIATFTISKSGYSSITKVYKVSKSKDGQSASYHFVKASVSSIQRNPVTNTISPESLIITGNKKFGDNDIELLDGYFLIYEQSKDALTLDQYNTLVELLGTVPDKEYIISDSPYPYVLRYQSPSAENTIEYVPDPTAKGVHIEYYKDYELTILYDIEDVPIMSDGENSVSGYLTNPSVSFTCSKEGTVLDYSISSGTFKVNDGVEDVTLLASFSAESTGCNVTIDSHNGEYTLSAMTDDNAIIFMTAVYRNISITLTMTASKSKTGSTGASAYSMTVTPSNGNQFKFDQNGNNIGITSTTLNATLVNITNATYSWYKNGSATPISGATTSSYVVNYNMFTNDTDTYKCEAKGTVNGSQVTIYDVIGVIKTSNGVDGKDPITGYLTSESVTLPSSTTGSVSAGDIAKVTGTFKVFEGITEKTGTSITYGGGGTFTNYSISIATSGVYTLTALSSTYLDAISIPLTAVYKGVTVTRVLSVSKSPKGNTGDTGLSAYSMDIKPSNGNQFKFNGEGVSTGIASTVLTCSPVNITPTKYVWKKNGTVISGSTTASITVNSSDLASVDSITYTCELTGTVNGGSLTVSDSINIIKTIDGSNNVVGSLSNDAVTLPASNAGVVTSYTNSTGFLFRVFYGSSDVTGTGVTYSYTSSANYTASINSSGIYSVTAMSSAVDSISVPFMATYKGITITKYFTVTKSSMGAKGDTGNNAITMSLTNDSFTASVDKDGNAITGSYTGATTTIEMYDGKNKLPTTGWTYSILSTVGTVTHSISSNVYTATNMSTLTGSVTLQASHATYGTFTKVFSLSKSPKGATGSTGDPGQAAVNKWVEISESAIVKSITNVYYPSSIIITGKSRTGNEAAVNYTSRFKVDEMSDGTVVKAGTLTANTTSTSYTIVNTNINSLDVYMYETDGTTLIEKESINIVKDGNNSYGMNLSTNNGSLFTFNESNTSIGIANTTITPVFTNFTPSSYAWSWSGGSATTPSLTVSSSSFTSNASIVYTLVATGSANGKTGLTITDAITLNKTKDGASSYSMSLSNETVSFPTDEDGVLLDSLSSTGNTTTVYLYKGATSKTPALTVAASGCTATASGAVVTINSLTATSGYVDITVKDGTTTIGVKRFSFAKVKQGETTYSWKAYADDELGTGITQNPENKKFMGFAINKSTPTPSSNPLDYTWNAMYDLLALDEITLEDRDLVEGNPVFTDKAQIGSVVHVAIDGKSYQSSLTATPTTPSTITDLDADINIVSSAGGRNLIPNSHTLNNHYSVIGGYVGTREFISDSDALSGQHIKFTCTTAGTGFYASIFSRSSDKIWKTYTWSFYAKCSVPKTGRVGQESGGHRSITLTTSWQKFTHTFVYNDSLYSAFTFYLGFSVGEIFYIRDLKIEEGSISSIWTPAPENIEYNVSTNGIYKNKITLTQPIRSIGNGVSDEIFLDSDGIWKIKRNITKVVYNGTEDWNFVLNTNGTTASFWNTYGIVKSNSPVMSTHFTYVAHSGSYGQRTNDQISDYSDNTAAFMITTNKANSVATWKTFLAAEYAAGRPLTLYLPLINPIIEVLSDANQNIMNNIPTFSGNNYVYTVNNLTPNLHAIFKSKGWYRNFRLQNDSRETLNALNNLEGTILPALEDGILSESEISNTRLTQKQLNIAHLDIINRYSEVVKMAKIDSTVLSSLISVKNTYDTDYSNLVGTINNILSITATETLTVRDQLIPLKTNLINYFNDYEISIGVLSTSIQMALNSSLNTSIDDVNNKFSDYVQTATWEIDKASLQANISKSGGINIIRNSIGWNWYTGTADPLINYYWTMEANTRLIETIQSPELASLGFGSGWEGKVISGNTLNRNFRQNITLPYLGTYTISFYMKKSVSAADNSDVYVSILNNSGTVVAQNGLASGTTNKTNDFVQYKQTFTATSLNNVVRISIGYKAHAIISGVMLNVGSEALVWTPHSQEVYNSNIMMDINGITVGNNSTTNKTVITPYKFSGYSGDEEIFTLNGDTTKVKKLQAQERFIMDPLSIIAIDNANHSGWAFV